MLLIVGAWKEKDTSVSTDLRRHGSAQAPTHRIGILNHNFLFPSFPGARKDPTKGRTDPFVNVPGLHPFRFRNRFLGIQMDHQTQLRWELGGQQRWEHRVGLVSLRAELQWRVLLRGLRKYFNLDKMNQSSEADGRWRTLTMTPLISASSPFSRLSPISIRCSFRNTLSVSTALASINILRLAEA